MTLIVAVTDIDDITITVSVAVANTNDTANIDANVVFCIFYYMYC